MAEARARAQLRDMTHADARQAAAHRNTDATPEDSDVVRAARELRAAVFRERETTEARRRLPAPLAGAMVDAGLLRLAVPRADGGVEAPPLDALRVYEELAAAEASAAWIAWNGSLPALAGRLLDPEVRHRVFADPGLVMANSTRPTGRAAPAPDGYRVTGRWSLVSGCELATLMLLRCVVETPGEPAPEGPPDLIMAYVPREQCRVIDTWHSGGLRGTGSHDVVVDDAFVPARLAVRFSDPCRLDTPLYRMPFAATLAAGCAAICLGIARAAVETVIALARDKTPVDAGPPMRERGSVLVRVADLCSAVAAARALLHAAVRDAFEACEAGQAVSLEMRASLFAAARFAAIHARDAVRRAYELGGTSALYVDCPLERAHRDVHAACQHIILNELWLEDAGRVWLGGAPASPMFVS